MTATGGSGREGEQVDESVIEVSPIGEFDVFDLVEQGERTGPLADAEQCHLRALPGDVTGADDTKHRHLRNQAYPDRAGGGEVGTERAGQEHLLDIGDLGPQLL